MISNFTGETKECTEFAKQFLERRSKYKNQQRAQNAHIDDMCSPAPAINPSSNDFQEVKVCIIHGISGGEGFDFVNGSVLDHPRKLNSRLTGNLPLLDGFD